MCSGQIWKIRNDGNGGLYHFDDLTPLGLDIEKNHQQFVHKNYDQIESKRQI